MKSNKNMHKNKNIVCNYVSKVLRLREKYGWTQEFLAAKAGISRKTLSRLETGDLGVTYRTMQAVFKALGIEVCEQCSTCRDE
ncbi:MAG: hypothetical protein DRI44_00265 [Chlamydiae bacterium]|nr:MAG: hypothetical protein DRI44_00265 [Chlamydiota bacterium]